MNAGNNIQSTNYRKLAANTVTGLSAVVLMYLTTGGWDEAESIALLGVVTSSIVSLLVPGDPKNQ